MKKAAKKEDMESITFGHWRQWRRVHESMEHRSRNHIPSLPTSERRNQRRRGKKSRSITSVLGRRVRRRRRRDDSQRAK